MMGNETLALPPGTVEHCITVFIITALILFR